MIRKGKMNLVKFIVRCCVILFLFNFTAFAKMQNVGFENREFPILAVAAGYQSSCALQKNRMRCVGQNLYGHSNNVDGFVSASNVTMGSKHTCVLENSEEVWCWGSNEFGQLEVPFLDRIGPIKTIAAGGDTTCALSYSGRVKCWGRQPEDSLGLAPNVLAKSNRLSFSNGIETLENVKAIAVASEHVCAATPEGVHCWGVNFYEAAQEFVPILDVHQLSTHESETCALAGNTLRCWGLNPKEENLPGDSSESYLLKAKFLTTCLLQHKTEGDELKCWGTLPSLGSYTKLKFPGERITDFSVGYFHLCVLGSGSVRCFGDNSSGETQFLPAFKNPRSLSIGTSHICGIEVEEKKETLRCWGDNRDGIAERPADLGKIWQVAAGNFGTCAILEDHSVKCWGRTYSEVDAELRNVKKLSLGTAYACAIAGQEVKCWGPQDGMYDSEILKVPTDIQNPEEISVGKSYACVVERPAYLNGGSQAKCWGNFYGSKVNAPAMKNPKNITIGAWHACAEVGKGIQCWGPGVTSYASIPKGLENSERVAVGRLHTCAINEGQVFCWGDNDSHQLEAPKGLINPREIFSGAYNSCVIDDLGLHCWGDTASNLHQAPQDF